MKFRKKPIVVEALQYIGNNWEELEKLFPYGLTLLKNGSPIYISTPEGRMEAQVGDWIIKGINDEIYPCKPDIFKKTYKKIIKRRSKEKKN